MPSRPQQPATSAVESIETPRLLLLPVTEAALRAEKESGGLEQMYRVIVPSTWPPQFWDQQAMEYLYGRIRSYPQYQGWARYVAVKQPGGAQPALIGGCGCTAPPQLSDEAEIGYSILNEFRRHGYVTEAIQAFVPWIFSHDNVQSVCAQTYPHLAASVGVLRKCGFVLSGTGRDPGTVLFRRMRDEASS